MKVYLWTDDFDPHVRFVEEPRGKAAADAHAGRTGLRGWAERAFDRYQRLWHESRGGLARRARGVWEWLHRRTDRDERHLARLRSAEAVEVHHPAEMPPEEAGALWARYLARRRRRHWVGFAANALVTPLTVVLMPLPGPNLIGYWFVYRSIHHLLVLNGLRKVRSGRVAVSFHSDEESPAPKAAVPSGAGEEEPRAVQPSSA